MFAWPFYPLKLAAIYNRHRTSDIFIDLVFIFSRSTWLVISGLALADWVAQTYKVSTPDWFVGSAGNYANLSYKNILDVNFANEATKT